MLVFTPADGRVTTALVMPGIALHVDVSVAPATAVLTIHQAAAAANMPVTQAEAVAVRALHAAATAASAWAPDSSEDRPLLARLGGASFPLLAAAYEAGAAAVDEVPRWSTSALVATTARAAAESSFEAKATRPVIAAIATTLSRMAPAPVDFSRLALARCAVDALEPDQIARLLLADGPTWEVAALPEPHTIEVARRVLRRWGTERTMRVLHDVCARADGLPRLLATVRIADDLGGHAPHRLPMRLDELHDVLRSHTVMDPNPDPAPARVPRRPPVERTAEVAATRVAPHARVPEPDPAPAPEPPRRRREYGLHVAPPTRPGHEPASDTHLPHPRWLVPVDRHEFGIYRFVLPRTAGDLTRWSNLLSNCLGDFRRAAMTCQSHIVGVERNGQLKYAIELTPQRRIRQFTGTANRPPPDDQHDLIVDELTRLQAVR